MVKVGHDETPWTRRGGGRGERGGDPRGRPRAFAHWSTYSGRPQLPGVLIGTLGIIERIQANTKRLQLEAGHPLIDLLRNIVNARRQTLTGLEKIASAQRLVGKTQVHHCCWAGLRGNLAD